MPEPTTGNPPPTYLTADGPVPLKCATASPTPQPIRPADHDARERAAEYLNADTPNSGTPLWEAIVALDTLAIMAGIPNPAATVTITGTGVTSLSFRAASHDGPEALAAACLRRAAAWATALANALPQDPEA